MKKCTVKLANVKNAACCACISAASNKFPATPSNFVFCTNFTETWSYFRPEIRRSVLDRARVGLSSVAWNIAANAVDSNVRPRIFTAEYRRFVALWNLLASSNSIPVSYREIGLSVSNSLDSPWTLSKWRSTKRFRAGFHRCTLHGLTICVAIHLISTIINGLRKPARPFGTHHHSLYYCGNARGFRRTGWEQLRERALDRRALNENY